MPGRMTNRRMPVRKVSVDQFTEEERARIARASGQQHTRLHSKPAGKDRLMARWDTKLGKREQQDAKRKRTALQHHRERPAKATKTYDEYTAHPIAKFVMSFTEWRNPSERSRRLAEFGQ